MAQAVLTDHASSTEQGSRATTPSPPRPLFEQIHEISFIFILCLAQFLSLAAMNQTVAPVLILADYFDIHDYGNLSWFSAAYSMTVGTFILPAGRLGDIYGHKRIFMVGWAWFAIWSLVCGFCTESQLILFSTFRAFQGIGPALVIPNAIAIIGRTFPVGLKRNIIFACFGAAGPTGAAAGAVLAALVAQLLSWHWCFWLLAITCSCLFVISHFVIPNPEADGVARTTPTITPLPGRIRGSKLQTSSGAADSLAFDWPGAVTGVAGLVLVNFALNQAPIVGWKMPYIATLLVLGFLFLIAFVWVELRVATQPIIPLRGLQRNAAFTLACVFAGWSSHGIWVYYLYIFLEHLRGHSALRASAETSPVAVTGILFAMLTVWLMGRIAVSWVMLFAMFFFTLGSILMAVTPLSQTYWANTFVAIVLMPGAMNLSFPAATILLSSALPKEKQGIAASLVATVVNYSISCGLGLAGTVHKHSLGSAGDRVGIHGPPPALSVMSPQLTAMRLSGLRSAYWFAVGLGGLGMLIAALFILVQITEAGRSKTESTTDSQTVELEAQGGQRPSFADSDEPTFGWSTPQSHDSPTMDGDVVNKFYLGDKVIQVTEKPASSK
ncbi:major facilitator superfamily-domain-containing protein [Apodospora peruviana]|uniref:Major facilitator superfamily-domain-containing protein n=1 Tax=Apodospora peruviana TaxID=516989 RepID=A0AAE0HVD5_9PEZI|nr:major facilitator superfamily-domain-containing protein [Apodospora peruviana]